MNIALIRLSALGDIVHGLPVATALRAVCPEARLTWVVDRRHGAVLQGHPALDDVICVDVQQWRRARRLRDITEAARQITATRSKLRDAQFDVAIDLQGLLKSGLVTAATGARIRIGFAATRCREPLNAMFTNRRVTPPAGAVHVVDQNLTLLSALDVRRQSDGARFDLPSKVRAEALADEFFAASGLKPRDSVVVLNPGAGRPAKRWPAGSFMDLARQITDGGVGKVVVVWGPGERNLAQDIVRGCGARDAVAAPPTDVDALIAILRRASVMVSGDSGPLHLAAALGVPCIGLFGPTSAQRNGPFGAGHRTIESSNGTLGMIASAEVFRVLTEILP